MATGKSGSFVSECILLRYFTHLLGIRFAWMQAQVGQNFFQTGTHIRQENALSPTLFIDV